MKRLEQTQEDWDRLNNWLKERSGMKEASMIEHLDKIDLDNANILKEFYWYRRFRDTCKYTKTTFPKPPIERSWNCKCETHKFFKKDSWVVCSYEYCPIRS